MAGESEMVALVEPVDVPGERSFLSTCALVFLASAAGTVWWCGSMVGGMPMPGGWTMSMAWMRMAGQTWAGATASFVGMWVVMMVAMMLPSLVPMLARYRRAVGSARLGPETVLVAAGYFSVWTAVGVVAYPFGLGLAAAAMRWEAVAHAVPLATGIVLLAGGALQLTPWKARHLSYCRGSAGCAHSLSADRRTAWRHGLSLGLHCALCCAGLIAVLLVIDVMHVGAMAAVAAAITVERLAPQPEHAARAIGAVVMVAGARLVARAIGLG